MSGRVLVFDPSIELERVEALLAGTGLDVEPAAAPIEGVDVVAVLTGPDYPVTGEDFERLPALRVVSTCSVGFDHVDLEAARTRGIRVCNVPDYCVEEMADHALALLLGLLRGVVALDRSVREGAWDYTAAGPLARFRGTRLGVIGFGRIGRALAVRARALGFEVWAADPLVPAGEIEAAGVRPVALDELLGSCTAFSLHVPLSPATHGLIGAVELARMPWGSVLVNTARAQLVDGDALLVALDAGYLAGAAVDVLPVEPPDEPPPQHPLLVVTPHAGWFSLEAEEEVYRRSVLAVREVLEGRVPDEVVV
jgi:D-3-phosphoglycerate dehydrogenase